MEEWFGIAAAAVVTLGTIPAIADVLRGNFKPNRSSWLMWTVLLMLTLLLQYNLHSGWAIWATLADVVSCLAIYVLSLRYGVGGLTRIDVACYGVWAAAVGLWLLADATLVALHLAIVADLAAVVPILAKAVRHPEQESYWPHLASACGGMLAIAALTHYSYGVLLYPVYIAVINALTVLFIRRRFWRPDAQDQSVASL